jgi:hypothetical protein
VIRKEYCCLKVKYIGRKIVQICDAMKPFTKGCIVVPNNGIIKHTGYLLPN